MALTPARINTNKRWNKKNPEKVKYTQYRSYTKTFIKTMILDSDIPEIKALIEKREKELKK